MTETQIPDVLLDGMWSALHAFENEHFSGAVSALIADVTGREPLTDALRAESLSRLMPLPGAFGPLKTRMHPVPSRTRRHERPCHELAHYIEDGIKITATLGGADGQIPNVPEEVESIFFRVTILDRGFLIELVLNYYGNGVAMSAADGRSCNTTFCAIRTSVQKDYSHGVLDVLHLKDASPFDLKDNQLAAYGCILPLCWMQKRILRMFTEIEAVRIAALMLLCQSDSIDPEVLEEHERTIHWHIGVKEWGEYPHNTRETPTARLHRFVVDRDIQAVPQIAPYHRLRAELEFYLLEDQPVLHNATVMVILLEAGVNRVLKIRLHCAKIKVKVRDLTTEELADNFNQHHTE